MDVGAVIEAAVRFYEEPPAAGMTVETDSGDLRLSAADWAEAFETPDPGTPHNEARDRVWDELVAIQRANGSPAFRIFTINPSLTVTLAGLTEMDDLRDRARRHVRSWKTVASVRMMSRTAPLLRNGP